MIIQSQPAILGALGGEWCQGPLGWIHGSYQSYCTHSVVLLYQIASSNCLEFVTREKLGAAEVLRDDSNRSAALGGVEGGTVL